MIGGALLGPLKFGPSNRGDLIRIYRKLEKAGGIGNWIKVAGLVKSDWFISAQRQNPLLNKPELRGPIIEGILDSVFRRSYREC